MREHLIILLFATILLVGSQAHAQTTDSTAIVKSQQRIEENLEDANKHQRKIDKRQKKIQRQQKKINRQERKRERKMRKVEKEQKKISSQ